MAMKRYSPAILDWLAAASDTKYLALGAETDRYEINIYTAGAVAAFAVAVGMPALLKLTGEKDSVVPAPASVATESWVPLTGVTGFVAGGHFIITTAGRYLRFVPAGALANAVRVTVQHLPPTSP